MYVNVYIYVNVSPLALLQVELPDPRRKDMSVPLAKAVRTSRCGSIACNNSSCLHTAHGNAHATHASTAASQECTSVYALAIVNGNAHTTMRLAFSVPFLESLNGKRQYFFEERSRKL